MKSIALLYIFIAPLLMGQAVVIKSDQFYFIYNQDQQLEVEANTKNQTIKLLKDGTSAIYLRQNFSQPPFIFNPVPIKFVDEPRAIEIFTTTQELSRYLDINNGLYQIQQKFYINIKKNGTIRVIDGEVPYYSAHSGTLFYFKGDELHWYDIAIGEEHPMAIRSKKLTSVNGSSSYRWIFEDQQGFIWLYSRFEANNKILIYNKQGQLQRQLTTPYAIDQIYLSNDLPTLKARLAP